MKKFIFLLTTLLTMAVATACFAANDGSDLNKEQKIVAKFIDLIDGDPVPALSALTPDFDSKMAERFNEKHYTGLPKVVKEKLGDLKEYHFVLFQRYIDGDKLIYSASFSKEEETVLIFVFNQQGKLFDYAINIDKPQQEAQPAEQKAEN
jgi:hypothetical protein